jgi:TonB-dependent starch-binding outer membrane protein SusC
MSRQLKKLLLTMHITVVLLMSACLGLSAHGLSQRVSISVKDQPLEKVFNMISNQTDYVFYYEVELIKKTGNVSVDIKDADIKEALNVLFKNQPLNYTIVEKNIVVKPRISLDLKPEISLAAPPVTGVVRGRDGEPLSGVNILVKGTKKGTVSNADGSFSIDAKDGDVLLISSVGYNSKEIKVAGNNIGEINLIAANAELQEVIVNKGYYKEKKVLNTGDITTIKAEEIGRQPVSNPLSALQGNVPGLMISQTTGLPGGGYKVQIRGQNSIDNGNDPLYIIDGIPVPSKTLGSINASLINGNPLNFLNTSDIESIDVLKDADATAIYGSRGANGVILITTKKGQAGKTKLDVNVASGLGKVTRKMHLLNTPEYLEMRREAFKNDNVIPDESNAPDLMLWDTTRYTDWQKELFNRPVNYNDVQVSLSGGNNNTIFSASGGIHKETTVMPGDGADFKGSVHLNLFNTSSNKKFRINISTSYLSDKNTVKPLDLTPAALLLSPNAPPPFNEDGSLNWAPKVVGDVGTWNNPFAQMFTTYKGKTGNLLGNITVNYEVVTNLEFKASFGYNSLVTSEVTTLPLKSYDPKTILTSGTSNFNTNNTNSWIIEPQLNYKLKVSKGMLSFLLGGTFQDASSDRQGLAASDFSSDELLENIMAAGSLTVQSSLNSRYRYCAAFGRVNYSWKEKYLVNVTMRRDGSSRFGPSRQWATFGAVGAAWIFSDEQIIRNSLPVLSFGKIRGSYGSTGSDQIPDYSYLDLYSPNSYSYQTIVGLQNTKLFNPYLAWELNKKLEFGLELGFFKNRINLNANYYQNRSGNQLLSSPLLFVTGFFNITANLPAVVENKGWEFILTTTNIKKSNLSWSSSLNISINRNRLLSFDNLSRTVYSSFLAVGKPLAISMLYRRIGVDKETGINTYSDKDGQSTFQPNPSADLKSIISTAPDFFGGIQNSVSYKNIEFDFLFQFVRQIGVSYFRDYSVVAGMLGNQPVQLLERWQKPGDMKPYQKFTQDPLSDAYRNATTYLSQSDFVYSDASFIRLKNVSLSWSIPYKIKNKMNIQSCRLYIQCQNLLTFTNYNGLDPETQTVGVPPLRIMTAGIQISL